MSIRETIAIETEGCTEADHITIYNAAKVQIAKMTTVHLCQWNGFVVRGIWRNTKPGDGWTYCLLLLGRNGTKYLVKNDRKLGVPYITIHSDVDFNQLRDEEMRLIILQDRESTATFP